MKIVIPMSGAGSRFIRAGYTVPKPLICVDGKPIIAHVVAMYPGDHEFVFVCSREHLENTDMREVLRSAAPKGRIIGIDQQKKGPVYALAQIEDVISDEEPVLVSYCDFSASWDFSGFCEEVRRGDWDGAVPCYTGFHPHLLRRQLYGGVLTDGAGRMTAYREKYCFTENPMDSHHSAGNYYFSRGDELKTYVREVLQGTEHLDGECYMSQLYYLYLRDKKEVYVPELRHFLQWGTPEDLEEYVAFSRLFNGSNGPGMTDIPAEREALVRIPYTADSPEYVHAMEYWERYFQTTPT